MLKSEVQPLIPLISRVFQILKSLVSRHRVPDLVALAIAIDIVHLRQAVQNYVETQDPEQLAVTSSIKRRIVCSIHIRRYDPARLDEHVITGCGNGTRAYAVRVA